MNKKIIYKIIAAASGFSILILIFIILSNKKINADYYIVNPIDINYTILASCSVELPDPLEITISDDGEVKLVNIADGASIKKGELIIQLDEFIEKQNVSISYNNLKSAELKLKNAEEEELPKLKEKLDSDKITMDQAKKQFDRLNSLFSSGGIAKVDLENAENNYKQALSQYNQTKLSYDSFAKTGTLAELSKNVSMNKAQYELAKKKLEDKTILSPFDGTVLKVKIQKAQKVKAGTAVAVLLENKNWVLVLNIDQKELPFVKPSLPALIALDAYPDKKIKGEIVYICSDINKEKGTCELRIEIKEEAPFVKHGMTGTAEIFAEKYSNVNAVPSRFIIRKEGKDNICIWDGKTARFENTEAFQIGERWKIIENVKQGTMILDAYGIKNLKKLVPGKLVKPQ